MDMWLPVAGLLVGFVVGLTGMGGGALMTPLLVLVFHVSPLTAVSSDLVVSAIMKPVGGAVHLRKGNVNGPMVGWLCVGSIPTAFAGVFLLRLVGNGPHIQETVKYCLGAALLLASAAMIIKAYLQLRASSRGGGHQDEVAVADVPVRVLPTVLVGAVGGLIVGLTSVGSGSLIIISLMALYPSLRASGLVGTDLVQAVPLVASAAVAHMLFGDFQFAVAGPLLLGCLPGVWLGAHASARAPGGLVRRALALVLLASGLKLLGVGTVELAWILLAALTLGPAAWAAARRHHACNAAADDSVQSMT